MDWSFQIIFWGFVMFHLVNGNYSTISTFKVGKRTKLNGTADTILRSSFDCKIEQDGLFLRSQNHISMFTEGNLIWRRKFGTVETDNAKHYPIDVLERENLGKFLLARVESGLRFYSIDSSRSSPKPLFEDGQFADGFGWNEPRAVLAWGKIYPTKSSFGLLTRNKDGIVKFFSVSYQSLLDRDETSVRELAPPAPLLIEDWWSRESTQLFIVNLAGKGKQELIVAWGQEHFAIYKFNRNYNLEKIISEDLLSNQEFPKGRLMFGNITGSYLKDILLFQSSGLYFARWNDQTDNYLVEIYNTGFSEKNGWTRAEISSANLIDLNGDGRDELVYTGPSGLGIARFYPGHNNTWEMKEVTSRNISQMDNYSVIKAVSNCPNKKPVILLESEKTDNYEFEIVNLAMEDMSRKICDDIKERSSTEASLIPSTIQERDATLEQKWLDWFDIYQDFSSILSGDKLVNLQTGQVELSLPLFYYKGINMRLSYDSSRRQSSLMGVGWSISLAKDFIMMDTSTSIFEELHSYYISLDGALFTLNRTDFSSTTHKKFDVPSHNITATFHLANQTWIVSQGKDLLVFGGTSTAIQKSLVWPWGYSGNMSEANQLEDQSVAWYLTNRHVQDQSIQYKYGSKMSQVDPGKSYTSELYLEEILDNKNNISIKFGYTPKRSSWYTKNIPANPDGSLSFPIPLTQAMSLTSLYATTPISKQRFNFSYTTSPTGTQRLAEINQFLPNSQYSHLFSFEYNGLGYVSKVSMYKTDDHVKIDYAKAPATPKEPVAFPLGEMGDLVRAPDYLIHHRLHRIPEKAVKLSIYPNDIELSSSPTEEIHSNVISSDIKGYSILPFPSHIFLILINADESKRVEYLSKNSSSMNWISRPTDSYLIKKGDKILPLASSLIHITPGKSEVTLLQAGDKIFNKMRIETLKLPHKLGENLVESSQQNYVALYDNNNLFIIHKQGSGFGVKSQQVHGSFYTQISDFFKNFDLHQELIGNLTKQLTPTILKAQDNILVLSSPNIRNEETCSNLLVMELSKDYAIAKKHSHLVAGEKIADISDSFNNNEEEYSSFVLKYKREEDKYIIQITDLYGKIREDAIEEEYGVEKLVKDLNANEEWKKMLKNQTIWDWRKISSFPTPEGVCVGEDKIIRKGSGKLDTLPSSRKLRLGPHLVLWQKEEDGKEYEILGAKYSNKLMSMKISPAWNIMVAYPFFLAYPNKRDVFVIPFSLDGKGVGEEIRFEGESLHPLTSSAFGLVTVRNTSLILPRHTSTREIVVRSPSTLQESLVYKVSKIERVASARTGDVKRAVSYEYDTEKVTRIIPGEKKSDGGWIDINFGETDPKSTFYNAQGILVKTDDAKPSNESDVNIQEEEYILRNKQEAQILNTYPYKIKEDMISYVGFEEDEPNNGNVWTYENTNVVRTRQSFTGSAYLRLNSNLEKHFTPADQNGIFVAGAWIRAQSIKLKIDDDVPFFKVVYLLTDANGSEIIGLLGKIQDVKGDWAYAEVIADLSYAREEIYAPFLNIGMVNNTIPIRFKVVLSPRENQEIHVDNVAFYPKGFSFQANVYNQINLYPVLTHVIGSGGKVRQIVYSRNGRQIGVSENGIVMEMRNAAKPTPNPVSMVFESKYGFYEKWENSSFQTRWEQSRRNSLTVSQSVLKGNGKMTLKQVKSSSFAIRLDYALFDNGSFVIHFWKDSITLRGNGDSLTSSFKGRSVILAKHKLEAELILLCFEGRVVMWIDSNIIWDQFVHYSEDPLSLELTRAELHSFLFLQDPTLKLTYFNGLQEAVQSLVLETPKSVIVSHFLYDNLGRPFLKTRETRIERDSNHLLKYFPNFVTSFNESSRMLYGDVSTYNANDEGFPYFLEEYEDYPGGQVLSRGLPGKKYAIGNTFGTRTKVNDTVPFLTNMFPRSDGFSFKSRMFANGKQTFWVYKDGLIRATYIEAPSFDNRLTTYDYNDKKQLVAVLPPEYHRQANTFSRLEKWVMTRGPLENKFGTFYVYNDNGKLKSKRNREEGTIHFLYDSFGNGRFRVYQDESSAFVKTIFTYFTPSGTLWRSGLYTKSVSNLTELKPYLGEELPLRYTKTFQDISYSVSNPREMDRVKQIITYNEAGPVIDKIVNDEGGEVVEKSLVLVPTLLGDTVNLTLSTEWISPRKKKVCYPGSALCLLYNYNKMGHLVSIASTGCGSESDAEINLQFKYNARGQVIKEDVNGNVRKLEYNSPGFITSIQDKFASLSLSYEDKGYTASAPGVGIVSNVRWTPKWKNNLKRQSFHLKEDSPPPLTSSKVWTICLNALRRTGYLNKQNIPTGKQLKLSSDNSLPLLCGGRTGYILSEILSRGALPETNGYKVDYGSHGEVLRAKYWTPDQGEADEPLQPQSFSSIPGISQKLSLEIWQKLVEAEIIIVNGPKDDIKRHIGSLSNIEILREKYLSIELKNLDNFASNFSSALVKLFATYHLTRRQSISYTEFEKRILEWSGYVDTPTPGSVENQRKMLSKRMFDMIQAKNFQNSFFAPEFISKLPSQLDQAKKFKIGKMLLEKQEHTLGSHPFDIDVLQLDQNGNQKNFFRGHSIYNVDYRNDSFNQIENVTVKFGGHSKTHSLKYDSDGNVIEAPYKGITLSYDPITKRPTEIKLEDGGLLKFAYDGQGERVLKQVYSPSGYLEKETSYLRDERARVVMEKEVVREESTDSESSFTLTYFIYGPRGLIGFVRDGTFYAVITDHLGSVRMVTKGNEVIAAYDYMPYGELQKSYVNDPKGNLNFRFGGKEFDEETGLYNFHARLYDPSLGRFFQTDPLWQYSSPYLYAGNSPFSLVDPDGELFITLLVMGIGAVVGGYLNGAAVNNNWNPGKWDFSKASTYLGIGLGALGGALLPVGFGYSVVALGGYAASVGLVTAGSTAATIVGVTGTVTLGLGAAYLSAAASNNKWNLLEWEWDRPHTFNGMFQGFAIGSSIPGGLAGVGNMVSKIAGGSKLISRLLHTANFVAASGVAYGIIVTNHGGEFNLIKWDWKSPQTYFGLSTGFYSGYAWPTLLAGSVRGVGKLISSSQNIKWNRAMITTALKNPKSFIYKTVATATGAYVIGAAANEDFDITSWNFKSFTTYQGIFNGAFLGKGLHLLAANKLFPKPTIKVTLDYNKLRTMSVENPAQFEKFVGQGMSELNELMSKFKVKFHVINKPKLLTHSPKITSLHSSRRSSVASLNDLEKHFRKSSSSISTSAIKADRRPQRISCVGGRRSRAFVPSCLLKPDTRSDAVQKKIRWSPSYGLSKNAITTRFLENNKGGSNLINNDIIGFNLWPLKPNQQAFAMIATSGVVNSHVYNTAYYVETGGTITIPASPLGNNRAAFEPLVVTAELSGCSLYVRHNPDANTLNIFHHRRVFAQNVPGGETITRDPTTGKYIVRNPATRVDELYDDVLSWEEYYRKSSDAVRNLPASTAFLYYEKGRWHFGNQKISFLLSHVNGRDITHIHLEGFSSRAIAITGMDDTIITPQGPAAPGA